MKNDSPLQPLPGATHLARWLTWATLFCALVGAAPTFIGWNWP